MNLVISYTGSEPGQYSMNLKLDCLHGETVCDSTMQIEVEVPEPVPADSQPALEYIGEIALPNSRDRLLFTSNQLLAIEDIEDNAGERDPADIFDLDGFGLTYSKTEPFAEDLFNGQTCYRAQDNSIIDNTNTRRVRQLTDRGELLKTLTMPSCNTDRIELSSKICGEKTYWICQQSIKRIDPASFLANITTLQNYPNITLLPGAIHYDNHYMDTLVVVNGSAVAIYEFTEGQLSEIASYDSEMRRPTGRKNRARSYGLDASSNALLRVDYEPDSPVEEQRFNFTGVETIQDVAVHENGLVAILHDSNRIRLFREESGARRLSASGLMASLMMLLSYRMLF